MVDVMKPLQNIFVMAIKSTLKSRTNRNRIMTMNYNSQYFGASYALGAAAHYRAGEASAILPIHWNRIKCITMQLTELFREVECQVLTD